MKRQRQEGGYVLVTVGVVLVALLGLAALAIDVGYLYSKRANYQRAADAAALAGVFTYVVEPLAQQPATAIAHATSTASSNPAMGTAIPAGQVTVSVGNSPAGGKTVTVDIAATSPTFFASIFQPTANISVTATAEVAPAPTSATCVKPWFIPNTALANLPAPGPNMGPCVACQDQNKATSKLLMAGTQAGGYNITNYAVTQRGLQLKIKPQDPNGALVPSQFYALTIGGTGANQYRANIESCSSAPIACGDIFPVKTGNMVGPTSQGVSDLIGSSPDTYISPGQYQLYSGQVSDTSHQLVLAPIWDTCESNGVPPGMPNFCPGSNFPSGSNAQVGVLGFALMFIEGVQGSNVVARLINVMGCGGGGAQQGQAPFAMAIRLVKP